MRLSLRRDYVSGGHGWNELSYSQIQSPVGEGRDGCYLMAVLDISGVVFGLSLVKDEIPVW